MFVVRRALHSILPYGKSSFVELSLQQSLAE